MPKVVSFRPTPEEEEILERTRRSLGAATQAEALRFLVRKGAERSGRLSDDPVFRIRAPKRYWLRRSLSSREIDDLLYGGRTH